MLRFLSFYALLFLVHQTAAAMFRVVAALTRSLVLAMSLGSLFLVVYLMLSGFILAKREAPCPSAIPCNKQGPLRKLRLSTAECWRPQHRKRLHRSVTNADTCKGRCSLRLAPCTVVRTPCERKWAALPTTALH